MPFLSGQRLTADALNALLPVSAVKAADTSRASNATPSADPELTITVTAGRTYMIEADLAATGSTAGDIQYQWSFGVGITATSSHVLGPAVAMTNRDSTDVRTRQVAPTTAGGLGVEAASSTTRIRFSVTASATGVISLLWAQSTSNATATVLLAGSYIVATPLSI